MVHQMRKFNIILGHLLTQPQSCGWEILESDDECLFSDEYFFQSFKTSYNFMLECTNMQVFVVCAYVSFMRWGNKILS